MVNDVKKIKINESIVKTYSYLRGNFSEGDFISSCKNNSKFEIHSDDLVSINFDRIQNNDMIDLICGKINNGVGEEVVRDFYNGKFLNIKFKDRCKLDIKNLLDMDTSTTIFNIDGDSKDSHLYFYSEILGNGDQFNYLYNINLKNNSKITLVVFLNSKSSGFINILGNCDDQSRIEVLFVNINKNHVYTNCRIYLNGEYSSSNIDVCYICTDNYKFDYNLTLSMLGKNSKSNINGKGVLLHNAHKVFRGTIDFQKGCTNSKGYENEEVIILSKNVKNQSLPLLLCKEKDVVGAHGFTANSIDQDKLFYLLSRGFNEKEAKSLILKGKFLNLFKDIDKLDIIEKFMDFLMEAI